MASDCTCQTNCGACGPSGTGCACPKNKCNCNNCENKFHTANVVLAPAPLIVAAARPIISRALVEHNFPPISYLREAICNYSATPNLISMTGVCI
ncbi:hypothetical protein L208DRAFT_315364 [Tricholoma matsutake]|nr:hypothetical protein L208DRAFT_315364 [Tricholoma matsutake 945]